MSPRKLRLNTVYAEMDRSRFNLSNREWSHNCGRLAMASQRKELKLRKVLGLQEAIDLLAQATSRSGFVSRYHRHIQARIQTADLLQTRMRTTCTRRWKFWSYQREQRAVHKLCTDLLGGLSSTDTLIVWGNGGFGPTSRGHAAAPNKKLQKAISSHIPLVVGSEYRSSKTSCCHHCDVTEVKWGQKTRCTIVKCLACTRLLGRDVNAANVIADIFLSVQGSDSADILPAWIREDDIRKTNICQPLAKESLMR